MSLEYTFEGPFLVAENLVVNLNNIVSLQLTEDVSRHLSGDTLDGYKLWIDSSVAFTCGVADHDDIVKLMTAIFVKMKQRGGA